MSRCHVLTCRTQTGRVEIFRRWPSSPVRALNIPLLDFTLSPLSVHAANPQALNNDSHAEATKIIGHEHRIAQTRRHHPWFGFPNRTRQPPTTSRQLLALCLPATVPSLQWQKISMTTKTVVTNATKPSTPNHLRCGDAITPDLAVEGSESNHTSHILPRHGVHDRLRQ